MNKGVCKYCGCKTSVAALKKKSAIRSKNISKALKNRVDQGLPVGRPKKSSYIEIVLLRNEGLSMQVIADKLRVSKGSVQYALRGVK